MKLKDIKPGNYYLTKPDQYTPPQPVKALAVVEEKSYSGYGHYDTGRATKKIKVANLIIDDEGSVVEHEKFRPLMPGRIMEEISADRAVGMVMARAKKRRDTQAANAAAEKNGRRLIDALTAAGFAGASQSFKGITLSNYAIANWLRANPAAE